MPIRHRQPTFLDYLVVAITPALIMLLVGSLVFFLLSAFYEGEFQGRLRFVASLFVMAAVLIGRISITEGNEYATAFALPLAVVTWMALARFTDANTLFILAMIAITWWSAHRLAWDCTVLDEREEISGTGLIDAAGFGATSRHLKSWEMSGQSDSKSDIPNSPHPQKGPFWHNWWTRYRANRQRPHTPGVSLVYFAILTLPLVAIGQWAIGPENPAATRSAFAAIFVYVGALLALMATTSFLGMRRYLRQRRWEMPPEMARNWSIQAALFVLGIVLIGTILPRPTPRSFTAVNLGSRDRTASWFSLLRSDAVDNRDADANQSGVSAVERSAKKSPIAENQSSPTDVATTSIENQANQLPSNQSSPGQPTGDSTSADKRPAFDNHSQSDEGSISDQAAASDMVSTSNEASKPDNASASDKQSAADEMSTSDTSTSSRAIQPLRQLGELFANLGMWLRRLVIVAISAFLLWRYGSAIWSGMQALWQQLIAWFTRRETPDSLAEVSPPEPVEMGPAFSSFRDPFSSKGRFDDPQLVRHTFQALEAWAREQGHGRAAESTPDEFAVSLLREVPDVGSEAHHVVRHYDCLAYGGSVELDQQAKVQMQRLWRIMKQTSV